MVHILFLSLGSVAYVLSVYFQECAASRELLLHHLVECLLENSVILQGLGVSLTQTVLNLLCFLLSLSQLCFQGVNHFEVCIKEIEDLLIF